jgi:hypothetical protein
MFQTTDKKYAWLQAEGQDGSKGNIARDISNDYLNKRVHVKENARLESADPKQIHLCKTSKSIATSLTPSSHQDYSMQVRDSQQIALAKLQSQRQLFITKQSTASKAYPTHEENALPVFVIEGNSEDEDVLTDSSKLNPEAKKELLEAIKSEAEQVYTLKEDKDLKSFDSESCSPTRRRNDSASVRKDQLAEDSSQNFDFLQKISLLSDTKSIKMQQNLSQSMRA